ncbi:MAG: cation:proton antiporter [Candidatus Aenigmarchaeota archaeon]|nr:cation:proton antiporter [Candidatus Aenigmarchaeota archaeon]
MANLEIFDLALLLFGAKMGGILFYKLRQPSLAGELLAGVILGSSMLNLVKPSPIVESVGQLGLMFLVLLTTLSIEWQKIEHKVELYSAIELVMAAAVIAVTYVAGSFLGWNIYVIAVVALALMQSSLVIASRTLANLGELNSKEGETIIGFQVVNDVVAILSIAAVANFLSNSFIGVEAMAKLIFIIVGFFVVMSRTGVRFITLMINAVQKYGLEDALLGLTLVLAFTMASFTEKLGIESFLGVFLAGLLLSKTSQAGTISKKVKDVGESFFIPIFFASIGLSVNVPATASHLSFVIPLVAFAIVLKMLSYVIPLMVVGHSTGEAYRIGAGMVSISEMSLIILSIGLASGAIDLSLYSTMVLVFLFVNIISPFVTSLAFRNNYRHSYGRRPFKLTATKNF